MTLILADEGKEYEIVGTECGRGAYNRFAEMGLYPGTKVKVINNTKGPIIVALNNTRYAIGKGLASKIMVREIA